MAIRLSATIAAILLVFTLGSSLANGQAGVFSRMGFGARGIGMSNALVADVAGGASAYYNPALAPFAPQQRLSGTVALMTLDRQLQYLEFATPLRPQAGVAAGLIHAGVTGIDGRDASGYHTEDYSTDEFAFFLAFGTRLGERLSAGVSLQVFRADYFEEVTASNSIGIDLGVTYGVTEALSLGLVVDDLLAQYNWDTSGAFGEGGKTTRDNFPTRYRVGAAYELLDGLARINREDGLTVLVNLHTLDTARAYCDRIVAMRAGRVMFDGTAAQLDLAPHQAGVFEHAEVLRGRRLSQRELVHDLAADAGAAPRQHAQDRHARRVRQRLGEGREVAVGVGEDLRRGHGRSFIVLSR